VRPPGTVRPIGGQLGSVAGPEIWNRGGRVESGVWEVSYDPLKKTFEILMQK